MEFQNLDTVYSSSTFYNLTFQAFRATLLTALPFFCFQLMQVTGADVPGKRHLVKFNAAAALVLCKTANRSIRLYGDNMKYFERS